MSNDLKQKTMAMTRAGNVVNRRQPKHKWNEIRNKEKPKLLFKPRI